MQQEAMALQRTERRRYAKEMQFVETQFDETQWPGKVTRCKGIAGKH